MLSTWKALSLLKISIRNLNSFHLYSLGGFTVLSAAVGSPEQIAGVALLNSAGQFADASRRSEESEETILNKFILKPLREVFQRVVLGFLFWQAKQPSRIESVLKNVCHFRFGTCKRQMFFCDTDLICLLVLQMQVYINTSNVDDYLVESISKPANDPNAGEVYYRYT